MQAGHSDAISYLFSANPSDHCVVCGRQSLAIYGSERPGLTGMEQHSTDTCIEDASSVERGYCRVGHNGEKFTKALPGTFDSGCDSILAST